MRRLAPLAGLCLALSGCVTVRGMRARESEAWVIGHLQGIHEAMALSGSSTTLKTEWVGPLPVTSGDKYFMNVGWIPSVEMGLREDGVIIWRKADPK